MRENLEFLAKINPCEPYNDLILTLKDSDDEKYHHYFNYTPVDSITNQLKDSICINSFNRVVYHKDSGIFCLDRLLALVEKEVDEEKMTKGIVIEEGENDVPINATKKIKDGSFFR